MLAAAWLSLIGYKGLAEKKQIIDGAGVLTGFIYVLIDAEGVICEIDGREGFGSRFPSAGPS